MLKLYARNNPPDHIDQIVSVLNDGGIIIYPTGTTYALGCHALKEKAVERLCRLRNIDPHEHSLSIICYDVSEISRYAHISTSVYKILKRNFPGPFTFILKGKRVLPKIFRYRKNGELGIRMPECSMLSDILQALGAPLITTSLPVDEEELEEEYKINPELIDEHFSSRVDLVIDGGMGCYGLSTVVDCQSDDVEIVRQGDGILLL